jgi:hypothetical protein
MKDTRDAAANALADKSPTIALRYLRENLFRVVGISVAAVVPCFWHRRIEAGDLASHTYNAWLAQLIAHGRAPGLYLAHQWNNILVDLALTKLGGAFGFDVAEKVVVPACVLIFFWGTFAIITAATRREPWFLVPAIAMVAYGWTFQIGFLNYYLSLGLAFFSAALFWRRDLAGKLMSLLLAVLAFMAHPVGLLWLVAIVIYITLDAKLQRRWRWALFPAALVTILGVHFGISHVYRTYDPVLWQVYRFIGPDQIITYGHRYRVLAAGVFVLALGFILGAFPEWKGPEFRRKLRIPVELWLLSLSGTAMVWGDIVVPRYATGFTFLPMRLSTITAVLGLSILGCVQPRKWHLAVLLTCGVVFFWWMYQDTTRLNRLEEQAESLVRTLPYGHRVVPTIWAPQGWRIGAEHVVDRACIGRCFVYSNYEPSTRQFRVRIVPEGSPIVASSPPAALAMSDGKYVVQPADLPMAQIYQCDENDPSKLCIRQLAAGEVNGRISYQPPH